MTTFTARQGRIFSLSLFIHLSLLLCRWEVASFVLYGTTRFTYLFPDTIFSFSSLRFCANKDTHGIKKANRQCFSV